MQENGDSPKPPTIQVSEAMMAIEVPRLGGIEDVIHAEMVAKLSAAYERMFGMAFGWGDK